MTDTTDVTDSGGFDRIEPVDIQSEMQRSYIDYAMSVIVGRALPDVRDGLKPVHRKILYGMYDSGFRPDRNYVKCGRVVGDVMGNYHPHGDTALYDALVRMAQPWSLRYPMIDPQGNFGSPGNDPAAAYRYTECRLQTARDGDAAGHRRGDRRLHPQLRGQHRRAGHPAGAHPEPAGQRIRGHRGRHGHPHPAAQPARGRRRRHLGTRSPRRHRRGAARGTDEAHPRPGLPDQGPDRRPGRDRGRVPHRSRLDPDARGGHGRGGRQGTHHPGGHRAAVPGEPGQPASSPSPRSPRTARSPASPTSTTSRRTASACGSW